MFFDKVNKLKIQVENDLKNIQEQFQQHLESINDNTNEIQANYEYLCQLDNKIEKLGQRLDHVQMLLKQVTAHNLSNLEEDYQVQTLTLKEKEVFVVLYAEDAALGYTEIASKINLTDSLVQQYITNLIEKGVPIIKEYRLGRPYMRLDKKFKELQAKSNLLNIDEESLKKVSGS